MDFYQNSPIIFAKLKLYDVLRAITTEKRIELIYNIYLGTFDPYNNNQLK